MKKMTLIASSILSVAAACFFSIMNLNATGSSSPKKSVLKKVKIKFVQANPIADTERYFQKENLIEI